MWYICSVSDQVRQLNLKSRNLAIQAIRASLPLLVATFVGVLNGCEIWGAAFVEARGHASDVDRCQREQTWEID